MLSNHKFCSFSIKALWKEGLPEVIHVLDALQASSAELVQIGPVALPLCQSVKLHKKNIITWPTISLH